MKDVQTVVKGVLDDFFTIEPDDIFAHAFVGVIIDDEDKDILATAIEEALESNK